MMQMRSGIYYLYPFWSLTEFQGSDGFLYPREDFREDKESREQRLRTYKINRVVLYF